MYLKDCGRKLNNKEIMKQTDSEGSREWEQASTHANGYFELSRVELRVGGWLVGGCGSDCRQFDNNEQTGRNWIHH